jgi:hypothetical protein
MDIEGSEGGALDGMSGLSRKNKTVKVVTEFWPLALKGFGPEPRQYLEMLLEHGFRLFDMNARERS